MKQINFPAIFTIFGITGDLAKKKLISSLFELSRKDLLPKKFKILGFSHTNLSDQTEDPDKALRNYIREVLSEKDYNVDSEDVEDFLNSAHYQQGDLTKEKDFEQLKTQINKLEEGFGQCANKLYYFSIPPKFYEPTLDKLCAVGLNEPCSRETGWARVLIEKPFGKDIESSKSLDKKLSQVLQEEQIFRIDHYLKKSMVQNILTFRFSNSIFEPVWNKEYIEQVNINMHEDFGVEDRGSFYDNIGTLRDVGKNHCLQMLATIAMDNPKSLEGNTIRSKRADILSNLHCFKKEEVQEKTTRAQYEGYKNIEGVAEDSDTETFFRLETTIENEKWKGVPFVIESGKQLHRKHTTIEVIFKPSKFALCPSNEKCEDKNKIIFTIQPKPRIEIDFVSKKPGFKYELEHKKFNFDLAKDRKEIPAAYQKVLYDGLKGDQTMFASTKEIEATWEFTEPILKSWEDGKPELQKYKKGIDPDNIE